MVASAHVVINGSVDRTYEPFAAFLADLCASPLVTLVRQFSARAETKEFMSNMLLPVGAAYYSMFVELGDRGKKFASDGGRTTIGHVKCDPVTAIVPLCT